MEAFLSVVASLLTIWVAVVGFSAWLRRNKKRLRKSAGFGGGDLSRYIAKDKWRVAIAHYPPLSVVSTDPKDGTHAFSGPVVELLRTLGEKSGKELEFFPLRWDRLEEHFVEDNCNLLAPVFPTKRRDSFSQVAASMYTVALGVVCLRGLEGLVTPTDLAQNWVRIGVTEGEVG